MMRTTWTLCLLLLAVAALALAQPSALSLGSVGLLALCLAGHAAAAPGKGVAR